jgi:indolepyruvate ferredoxin oxidoreductase
MAAHLEGKGVVTQDAAGLAQKGGATWSHIQIANRPEAIHTTKVDTAKADLVIGCDSIVAANKATLAVMQPGRTFVALNTHGTPTALRHQPRLAVPQAATARAPSSRLWARSWWALRRRAGGGAAAGRQHLHQPAAAGLRLAEGPRAAVARRADARHGAQRRAGRQQQGRLRVGPPLRARPGGRAGAVPGGTGDPVREEALAGRDGGAARGVPHRLPGRGLRGPVPGLRREGAAAEARWAAARAWPRPWRATCSSSWPTRTSTRWPACTPTRPSPTRSPPCSRATTSWCTTWRRPSWPSATTRASWSSSPSAPGCAGAFGLLARLKGLRGGALDIFGKTEERRTERALIRRVPCLHRGAARGPDARAPGAGGRDRAHPRGHPRLRPREGAPPVSSSACSPGKPWPCPWCCGAVHGGSSWGGF